MDRFARMLLATLLAWAGNAAASELAARAGDFLVAHEGLPDPNFGESVVLVVRSEDGGTAGLIVNRPTRMPIAKLFPDLEPLASLPDTVFFGGPVALNQISFLVRADRAPHDSVEVVHGVFVSESATLLRELLSRPKPTEGLRIYAGSAGWGPLQLQAEMERGDWHRMAADAPSIFSTRPQTLWQELDRRASSVQASLGADCAEPPAGRAVERVRDASARVHSQRQTCRGSAMKVNEVMTRNVCIASPRMSIAQAAKMMAECDSGALPVGEEDRLVGMITDRDIAIRAVARGKPHETPVREVMSHEVLYCFDDEDIDDIARNMAEQQVRRLPVVNRDKRLVGIVSLGDLSLYARPQHAGEAIAAISRPGGLHDQVLH